MAKRKTEEVYSSRVFRVNYGEKAMILSRYPQYPGVIFAPPTGTRHLAHITYLKAGAKTDTNRGSIDQFLITDLNDVELGHNPEFIDISERYLPKEKGTEEKYGVHYSFLRQSSQFEDIARRAAIRDIFNFHEGKKPPVLHSEVSMETVEKFTGIKPILSKKYALIDGKYGKQAFEPECAADLNLDFARWCVTSITSDFLLNPELQCLICYNGYKHKGYPFYFQATREHLVKQIKSLKEERAKKGLPTRYLRLAKGTEVGHPMFRPQLKAALEACIDEGLKAFMPQKFLEPDEEIARLFRESNSVLLVSLDNDQFDAGACNQRRTNEARFRDGLWYLDKGVNAVPFVNLVLTQEMGGPYYQPMLEKALKEFPRVQGLPARIRKKKHSFIIGGWENTVGERTTNILGETCGGCDVTKDHQRLFNWVHPSLDALIGDNNGNFRLCHHCHTKSWCGKCFLPGENGLITARTPVKITKSEKNKRPRRKKISESYNRRETLFDMEDSDAEEE